MKLSQLWSKIGKQPLRITQHTDAKVFVGERTYHITDIKYENGKFLGFNGIPVRCSTCKYLGKTEPNTCDICTDIDYSMWEYGKQIKS